MVVAKEIRGAAGSPAGGSGGDRLFDNGERHVHEDSLAFCILCPDDVIVFPGGCLVEKDVFIHQAEAEGLGVRRSIALGNNIVSCVSDRDAHFLDIVVGGYRTCYGKEGTLLEHSRA